MCKQKRSGMKEDDMNINKSATPPLAPELIEKFRKIVGDRHAITDAADIEAYVTEERNLFHGRSPLVLRPGSTAEVSAICKLASEHRIALVPQGGNTGLVGGQTPHNGEVVVSLRRLDKIREVDTASNTMTCESGVVLQIAQQKAAEVDRLFPLSLGAEEAARSAAISRPMPAARPRSPLASHARWRWGSKWCWPTDACSTCCRS